MKTPIQTLYKGLSESQLRTKTLGFIPIRSNDIDF